MNINLEYYQVFYYVAKAGNITLAAKELCISQPAVSQGIKALENDLDTELFIRTKRGVKLTQAGETLFHYVAKGYESILLGEKKLTDLKDIESGEIRIGASDMTLQYYLLPYLEKFHQLYPGIKVTVTNAPTPLTIEHLYANRIDFGIVSTPLPGDTRLSIRDARPLRDCFIAGKKFEYLRDQVLSYHDLMELPLICLEPNTSTRKYVDTFLLQNAVSLTPEFELSTSNMIVQFAAKNLGIGSVVYDFAEDAISDHQVFELKFNNPIPARKMCIISDHTHGMSVAAKKLMELL